MDRLEILIDNLLVYLPADTPFLADLIVRPEGRYILFGLAVVIALLVVWTVLALLQMIFFGQRPQPVTDKTPSIELSEPVTPPTILKLKRLTVLVFSKRLKMQKPVRLVKTRRLSQ